ncbi:MAG: OmpA family protein [Cyanobacteria bacterium P01_H01_bin.121]
MDSDQSAAASSAPDVYLEDLLDLIAPLIEEASTPVVPETLTNSHNQTVPLAEALRQAIPNSPLPEPNLPELPEPSTESVPAVDNPWGEVATPSPPPSLPVATSVTTVALEPSQTAAPELVAADPRTYKPWKDTRAIKVGSSQKLVEAAKAQVPPDDGSLLAELAQWRQAVLEFEGDFHSPRHLAQMLLPAIAEALQLQLKPNQLSAQPSARSVLAPKQDTTIASQIEGERTAILEIVLPVINTVIDEYLACMIRSAAQQFTPALPAAATGTAGNQWEKPLHASEPQTHVSSASSEQNTTTQATHQAGAPAIAGAKNPFAVLGALLVHRGSGLVICQELAQHNERLTPDILAGIKANIRSCISEANAPQDQGRTIFELIELAHVEDINTPKVIPYRGIQIVVTLGNLCALTVIFQGSYFPELGQTTQEMLLRLQRDYHLELESFSGDPSILPPEISQTLQQLLMTQVPTQYTQAVKRRRWLQTALLILLALLPLGWFQYRWFSNLRTEQQAAALLDQDSALAAYKLNVDAQGNVLTLTGNVPTEQLNEQAIARLKEQWPNQIIVNDVAVEPLPILPTETQAEVERLVTLLNQTEGYSVMATLEQNRLDLSGSVPTGTNLETLVETFAAIPGVNSIESNLKVRPSEIAIRVYFYANTPRIEDIDIDGKLVAIAQILNDHPDLRLRLVGYGNAREQQQASQLSNERADVVRDGLVSQGIDPSRLVTTSRTGFAPGVDATKATWRNQCVIFEILN